MQASAALCVAHAVATLAAVVRAAPPSITDTIHLSWTAPSGCPGAEEIEADIHRILGASPRTEERLSATGTVSRSAAGRWRAEVTTQMGGMEGNRTLHGRDCEEVTHAAALVLALMLKPDNARRQPTSRPPPPAGPTRTEAPEPTVSGAPPAGPWLARGAVLTGVGTLPGLEAGYAMHLGAATEHWAAELRGAFWLPKTAHSSEVPGAGARFWLVELAPTACFRAQHNWLRLDTNQTKNSKNDDEPTQHFLYPFKESFSIHFRISCLRPSSDPAKTRNKTAIATKTTPSQIKYDVTAVPENAEPK